MKSLVALLLSLVAAAAYADRIDCTTQFMNVQSDQSQVPKHCGAVNLDKARDDGVKYRRQPRMCGKIDVEFFSIRPGDMANFTKYCDEIHSKSCYMVGIRDNDSHLGIGRLSSHVVFPGIDAMPAVFSIQAHGVGHNTKPVKAQLGRIVEVTLSCRKTKN